MRLARVFLFASFACTYAHLLRYNDGQLMSTKFHEVFLPALKDEHFWTRAKVQPFIVNLRKLVEQRRSEFSKKIRVGPLFRPFLAESPELKVPLKEDTTVNFIGLAAKLSESKDRPGLQELFVWAVRHLTSTVVTEEIFNDDTVTKDDTVAEKAKTAIRKVEGGVGLLAHHALRNRVTAPLWNRLENKSQKEFELKPSFDSCSSFPVSKSGKFHAGIGETYGTRIRGGGGSNWEYAWNPRYVCTLGKALSNLPDDSSKIGDDAALEAMKYTWGNRTQTYVKRGLGLGLDRDYIHGLDSSK